VKVNIYETVEITDAQRVTLGALIDGKLKPKRQATRDEIKEFVWEHGREWEQELAHWYTSVFEEAETGSPEATELEQVQAEESLVFDDDDLIGESDDDEDLI
jgi:hypothetical protein